MKCNTVILSEGVEGVCDPVDVSLLSGLPHFRGDLPVSGVLPAQASEDPRLIVCGRCDSAMNAARSLLQKGAVSSWDCILAASQSSGRGQYRRDWLSPPGNIYAAWVFPHTDDIRKKEPAWEGLVSLLCGYVISESFSAFGMDMKIKWPNDLILNGRKTGGILVEIKNGVPVVGIGINLVSYPTDDLMRKEKALSATSLKNEGFDVSAVELWDSVFSIMQKKIVKTLEKFSPFDLINHLTDKLLWIGEEVFVRLGGAGEDFVATLAGLNEDGSLRVIRNGQEKTLYSGSIFPV